MEHLLNLFWLLVSACLLCGTVRAHGRGLLRCSLPLALAATALLALLLFPALSMTDDLVRSRLDVEQSARHIDDTLLLGTLGDAQLQAADGLVALLILLLALVRRTAPGTSLPWLAQALQVRLDGSRPDAVRPPPAL